MKCPNCHHENENEVKFCLLCGAPLPQRSKGSQIAIALLKSFCFLIYFIGLQSLILGIYTFVSSFQLVFSYFMVTSELSVDAINALSVELIARVAEHLHETMIVSALLTILILGLVYQLRGKKISTEIRLLPTDLSLLGKVVLCAVGFQFFISIALTLLPLPSSWLAGLEQNSMLLSGGNLFWQMLNIALLTPIVEEIIFRGLIFTRLRKVFSPVAAALISALLFGLVHGNWIALIYAGLLGFFMASLMERFSSILPCIFCHVAFNATSFLVVTLPTSMPMMLVLLSISAVLMVGSLIWIFKHPVQQNTSQENI